jgi:YbbR domain-containing protein
MSIADIRERCRNLLSAAARNWPAKALSLTVALVLFVFHSMSTVSMRSFDAPLNVELAPGMIPANGVPAFVRVNLRGEADVINAVTDRDIEAFIDMSRFSEKGTYHVPVQARKTGTALNASGMEITLNPIAINIEIDRR